MQVICPYCDQPAQFVTGAKVYPHRKDLHSLSFWWCDNGHEAAYVGCHKPNKRFGYDGTQPLGRLADARLRAAKKQAHAEFDPLWRDGYFPNRKAAYGWLANKMEIPLEMMHIGMLNLESCQRVVDIVNEYWEEV